MPDHHTWKNSPTPRELERHINAFVTELSKADFAAAFELCPALLKMGNTPTFLDPSDKKRVRAFVSHALFQAIEAQEIFEDQEEEIAEDEPKKWCKLITPPAKVKYEDLNLDAPEPGQTGEVLANVHLCAEATDITGRYRLLQMDGEWVLAFSNFEVM